jgi:rare lipoprotein A
MKRIVIIPVLLFISIISNSKTSDIPNGKLSEKEKSSNLKSKLKLPQRGKASFYNNSYSGKKTSNAEVYNPKTPTAAHETLPLGTIVKVTNIANGLYSFVKINDRCNCKRFGRIIDLSRVSAEEIGMIEMGVAKVLVEAVN